jgi:hypothetical protein
MSVSPACIAKAYSGLSRAVELTASARIPLISRHQRIQVRLSAWYSNYKLTPLEVLPVSTIRPFHSRPLVAVVTSIFSN